MPIGCGPATACLMQADGNHDGAQVDVRIDRKDMIRSVPGRDVKPLMVQGEAAPDGLLAGC